MFASIAQFRLIFFVTPPIHITLILHAIIYTVKKYVNKKTNFTSSLHTVASDEASLEV